MRSDLPVRGRWIEDIPEEAIQTGEGVNLWRQHILCMPDGRMALFYNSGAYGKEQLYLQLSENHTSPQAGAGDKMTRA